MFKSLKNVIFALFITALSLQAANKEISKSEIAQIESLTLFKNASIKVVKGFDLGSIYALKIEVKGKQDTIFLTKDKEVFITGGMLINPKTHSQITMPVDLALLKDKEDFVYGNGKDEYVLFTDLECPYCKKLESYLPQIKDKVKIRFFYYPLDFHKKAGALSLYVMSKKTQQEKIDAMFNIKEQDISKIEKMTFSKELQDKLDQHIQLGVSLGVQGTPALFDKDGVSITWLNLLYKYGIEVK